VGLKPGCARTVTFFNQFVGLRWRLAQPSLEHINIKNNNI
jgi:hypothetical protein